MKKKRSLCLIGIGVLLTLVISMVPQQMIPVKADARKNLYALEITTGASGISMDNIQAIVVNYKSMESKGKNNRVYAIIPKNTKNTWKSVVKEPDSENTLRAQVTEACGEKYTGAEVATSFLPYTTQTLFFYPYSDITEVTSIKIITSGIGTWSIQGMRLIRVEGSVKLQGNAIVSSHLQEVYSGTRIVEMQGSTELSWSTSSAEEFGTKSSSSEAYLANVTEDKEYHSYQDSDDYILRMDIADEYLAGLESLATESGGVVDIRGMAPADMLYTTIYYEDIYGDERVVKVPIISNVLAELDEKTGNVIGLAQQGNTLAISLRLYGFKKLLTADTSANNGIDVTLSTEQTQKQNSLDWNGKGTYEVTAKGRVSKATNMQDSLSLTGLSLYSKASVNMAADISSGIVNFDFGQGEQETAPDYYFSYKKSSGRMIQYGQTQKFTMKDNTNSKQKVPTASTDCTDLYLVEINTADMQNASTIDDLMISFTYQTTGIGSKTMDDGTVSTTAIQKTSNKYSVKDKVGEFYGYWPAKGDDADYFAYHEGTQAGGTLRFLISLSDVDSFVSATLSLDGNDEWQSGGIRISRVKSLNKRTVVFETEPKSITWGANTTTTDRIFDREVNAVSIAFSGEQTLVRANKSKTISFTESKSVVEDEEDNVLDPSTNSMTYEQACAKLGFDKKRISYDVDVTVAGSSASDSTNGDSGSKNLFYFRLNFENGSSAYVLANQQLSADGFRTGQTERFSVSMNQDYGELISVDVIPDDTGSNSEIYDKLNIAKIRVNRKSNNSLNRSWEISNPGWIGIDYVEDGEKNSTSGKTSTGRYAGEIASSFPVDKTSYNVKLMFAIATADYDEGDSQFSGSVQATLRYTDTANEVQTINFDMVNQMYSYAQIVPDSAESSLTSGLTGYQANTSLMFRANSTDRFFLDLADVKSVDSLTLKTKDPNGTTWKINSVGVSLVTDVGEMVLNSNNEYVYTGNIQNLTTQDSESTPAYEVQCGANVSTLNIGFQPNEIDINDESAENATATITRTPSGTNDTLNIFVFPEESQRNQIDNYDMTLDYRYVNTYGRQYANEVKSMQKDSSCFYMLGLSARNFSLLKGIEMRTVSNGQASGNLTGDEIIIQHIRSGVVIGTYRMTIANQNLASTQTEGFAESITNNETQTVTMYLGEQTQTKVLEADKTDIAVSIGYKSKLGGDTKTYYSPYVFLTDQYYKSISANKLIDIDFHVPYLSEITDIRVVGIGKVDATIESAVVATYEEDTSASVTVPDPQIYVQAYENYLALKEEAQKSRKATGWYSFRINKAITSVVEKYAPSNTNPDEYGTLVPVTIDLNAADTNASTETDLSLTLTYIRKGVSTEQEVVIPSVKERMGNDGSFAAGEEARIELMLEDVENMISMDIKTVNTDRSYSLGKATVSWNDAGTIRKVERYVNAEITSRTYTINFVDAPLYVEAKSVPSDGAAGITMNSDDYPDMSFGLRQGDSLEVSVDYRGISTTDDYSYELYQITGTDAKSRVANEKEVLKVSGNDIKIHTTSMEGGSYELHIIGGLSKKTVVVKFTVTAVTKDEPSTDTKDNSGNDATTDNGNKDDSKKEDTEETEE